MTGSATTGELDDSIVYGPGLRWAAMGTNLIYHLAGGETGMRHMLRQFGPCLKWPWTKLEAPELTEQLIDRMVEGTQAQAGGRSIRELERLRDDYLVAIQQVLRQFDIGAGSTLRALEERLYADSGRSGHAAEPCAARPRRAAAPDRDSSAAGMGRLQRPHDRFALPAGVRRCHRRAAACGRRRRVPTAASGRALYTVETHVTHRAEAQRARAAVCDDAAAGRGRQARARCFNSLHRRRDDA